MQLGDLEDDGAADAAPTRSDQPPSDCAGTASLDPGSWSAWLCKGRGVLRGVRTRLRLAPLAWAPLAVPAALLCAVLVLHAAAAASHWAKKRECYADYHRALCHPSHVHLHTQSGSTSLVRMLVRGSTCWFVAPRLQTAPCVLARARAPQKLLPALIVRECHWVCSPLERPQIQARIHGRLAARCISHAEPSPTDPTRRSTSAAPPALNTRQSKYLRCAGYAECVAGVTEYDPTQGRLLWPTSASLPRTFLDVWRPDSYGARNTCLMRGPWDNRSFPACPCEDAMNQCAGGWRYGVYTWGSGRIKTRWGEAMLAAWVAEGWLRTVLSIVAAPAAVAAYLLCVRTSLLWQACWVVEHACDGEDELSCICGAEFVGHGAGDGQQRQRRAGV